MRLMLVQKGCKIAPEDPHQVHKFKMRSKRGQKAPKVFQKGSTLVQKWSKKLQNEVKKVPK